MCLLHEVLFLYRFLFLVSLTLDLLSAVLLGACHELLLMAGKGHLEIELRQRPRQSADVEFHAFVPDLLVNP